MASQTLSLAAQDATPDLRKLRQQLRRSIVTTLLPEKRAHRDDLLALEKRYAAAFDYAGAMRTRDERLMLEQEIAAMEKEAPAETAANHTGATRFELKLSDATLSGARIAPKEGSITDWEKSGASATWVLPGLPPGGYEVLVRYTTDRAAAVMLKETYYFLQAGLAAGNGKSTEVILGTLRIRDGKGTLTFSPTGTEPPSALRLHALALQRVAH